MFGKDIRIKSFLVQEWSFVLVIIYKCALDFSYVFFEHKYFSYAGFDYEFDFTRIIIGWTVYLIGYYALNAKNDEVDSLFLYTMYLLSVAPFISLYQFSESCTLWMVIIQVSCLVYIRLAMKIRIIKMGLSKFKTISYKNRNLRLFITLLMMTYLVYTIYKYGIPSLESMGFSVISETRAEVELSTIDSIIQNIMCRVICPLYILVAWKERRFFYFGVGVILQIYTYGITGFKTYLFIPIVLLGVEIIRKINLKKAVLLGLPLALIMSDLITYISGQRMAYALIGDRVLFFSAKIKYAYFDFFSNHDFVYFSQNSISKLLGIKSNYSTEIPYMIGDQYFNKPNMWTNTGFIADAYSNGGVWAVLLVATLMTFILIVLRNKTYGVSSMMKRRVHTIFLLYFIMLHDGPFLSTLFSGGMIVAIMIVIFIDFYDIDSKDSNTKK